MKTPDLSMETAGDRLGEVSAARSMARSLWLVLGFAVMTGALRFAIWTSNWIILWRLYGWATVKHDHLQIVRMKPDLVVSNGDVLKGFGFQHYLVGVAIWIPLTFALLSLIFYKLVPQQSQAVLRERTTQAENPGSWPVLIVVPLAFLVTAVLPMRAAVLLALGTATGGVIWLRKLKYDNGT